MNVAIEIRCAWCGILVGVREGDFAPGLSVSHTICPTCERGIQQSAAVLDAGWDGIERRVRPERRLRDRRQSVRYVHGTLIAARGITWIDSEGTDRRAKVRRKGDRDALAGIIVPGTFE